jgi:hypothetical protein
MAAGLFSGIAYAQSPVPGINISIDTTTSPQQIATSLQIVAGRHGNAGCIVDFDPQTVRLSIACFASSPSFSIA